MGTKSCWTYAGTFLKITFIFSSQAHAIHLALHMSNSNFFSSSKWPPCQSWMTEIPQNHCCSSILSDVTIVTIYLILTALSKASWALIALSVCLSVCLSVLFRVFFAFYDISIVFCGGGGGLYVNTIWFHFFPHILCYFPKKIEYNGGGGGGVFVKNQKKTSFHIFFPFYAISNNFRIKLKIMTFYFMFSLLFMLFSNTFRKKIVWWGVFLSKRKIIFYVLFCKGKG